MKHVLQWSIYICLLLTVFIQIQPRVKAQSPEQLDSIYWFDWGQNGSRIAVASASGVTIYDSAFNPLAFRQQPDPNEALILTSISPDVTRLATKNEIWDINTLEVLLRLDAAYPLGNWSRDGKLISAVGSDLQSILVYDAHTGNLAKTISTQGINLTFNPVWSPDNTRFAATDKAQTLIIIDSVMGEIVARYPHKDLLGPISWSPDGTQLAYGGFAEVEPGTLGSQPSSGSVTGAVRNSVYIANAANGQILQTFTDLPRQIAQLLWSPDGNQLFAITGLGHGYIWDVKSGQLIDSYKTPNYLLVGVDYSPFGGQIMMGFNLGRPIASTQPDSFAAQSTFTHSFLDGAIQMIVPAPSTERLQAIMNECATNQTAVSQVNGFIAAQEFHNFTQAISRLPASDIPPGCAADLIAVAEALQAGQ